VPIRPSYVLSVIRDQSTPLTTRIDRSQIAVDAADYALWRKNDGTQNGYNTWRANFGRTAGNVAISSATVPKPATAILFVLGAAI